MIRVGNHHFSKKTSTLLIIEILVLMASVYIGAKLRLPQQNTSFTSLFANFFLSATIFTLVIVLSMGALGMYQIHFNERIKNVFLRLLPAFVLGFCILSVLFYLLPTLYFGRGVLGIVFGIAASGILVARLTFAKSAQYRFLESRVLFVGSGPLAAECGAVANSTTTTYKYGVVGYLAVAGEDHCVPPSKILSADGSLLQLAIAHDVDEIVVSVQDRRGGSLSIEELLECKLNGIEVTDSATFFEREMCQIRVDSLQPSFLVFGSGFDQSVLRTFVKRLFDIAVSLMIFVVSFPVMLLTSLLIVLEDRGPVFYRQERVGLHGQSYMVMKFRSMRQDAETAGSPQWASKNDPRTTMVGSVIRKLRIDELPQILNVLRGEMSFVGPRPERPYFVEQLAEQVPFYNIRHSVKPGITGMAQVRYPYGASVADAVQKLQYDLYYVKNNSLILDLIILLDTVQVVLFGKGAR